MAKIVKHLQENCPDRVDSFKAEAAKSMKEVRVFVSIVSCYQRGMFQLFP